jgi:hypothetical protein
VNQFGKLAEKIGILVQGGTVNVGQIRLDGEMSRQELRNRKALLNNVRTAWVEGVLEKSLHEQIPIVLGLENRPSAVASPWNLDIINPDKSCQPLPAGTPVIDVFDKLGEGGTLLILGEPGSGKTITLLQLARDLIARAEQELDRRIPVVLNLSSWAAEKQTIAKWIVEELNSKYQVNRKIGQQWVEKQELLLLLDGLDEIRDLEKRNACVTALNAFQQEQATEMVVCCRVKDYEQLGALLKLQSALVLQPLTKAQIQSYLDCLQSNLTVLKTLLIEDMTLQELAQSPLLLNIMVLAYQGIEIVDIPVSTIALNRKKQLFDDYINRIFQGSRPKGYLQSLQAKENQYISRQDATRWLVWMARKMVQHSQTSFLIEKLQPYWLRNSELIFYRLGVGLISLIVELIWILILGIFVFQLSLIALIPLFLFALIFPFKGAFGLIEIVENIKWSWEKCKSYKFIIFSYYFRLNFLAIVFWSLLLIQTIWITIEQDWQGFTSISFIKIMLYPLLLDLGLAIGSGLHISEIEATIYPNQGIQKSAINAPFFGVICIIPFGFFVSLLSMDMDNFANVFKHGGILGGMLGWSFYGGFTCIQHFALRLILYFTGRIPWNYAKFLDWASDKLFLQKVGGGYIFIHRSLMEHFAEMENG